MSELIHYGVLGMRWGVRKDGKPQGFQYGKRSKTKQQATKSSNVSLTNALRVYGAYPTSNLTASNEIMEKYHETSPESDMYMANAQYNLFDSDNKGNCALCTTAYDMRRRGYAVHAGANDGDGTSYDEIASYYTEPPEKYDFGGSMSGTEFVTKSLEMNGISPSSDWGENVNLYKNTLSDENRYEAQKRLGHEYCFDLAYDIESNMPPNARGGMHVRWDAPGAGGHSMIWETDSERNVLFRDSQTRETFTPDEFADRFDSSLYLLDPVLVYRTDNREPNINRMLEDNVVCNDDDYDINIQPTYDEVMRRNAISTMPPIPEDR